MSLTLGPAIILTGISISVTKSYRVQLWIGWAVLTLAMGVFTTIRFETPISHPIGLSVLVHGSAGMLYSATYFPVLAPLPLSENAHALAFFSFCRTFASVSTSLVYLCWASQIDTYAICSHRYGVSRSEAQFFRTNSSNDSPLNLRPCSPRESPSHTPPFP